eukprot:3583594-Rhodomonas_salina.2
MRRFPTNSGDRGTRVPEFLCIGIPTWVPVQHSSVASAPSGVTPGRNSYREGPRPMLQYQFSVCVLSGDFYSTRDFLSDPHRGPALYPGTTSTSTRMTHTVDQHSATSTRTSRSTLVHRVPVPGCSVLLLLAFPARPAPDKKNLKFLLPVPLALRLTKNGQSIVLRFVTCSTPVLSEPESLTGRLRPCHDAEAAAHWPRRLAGL